MQELPMCSGGVADRGADVSAEVCGEVEPKLFVMQFEAGEGLRGFERLPRNMETMMDGSLQSTPFA
jgi:hypothetical protein